MMLSKLLNIRRNPHLLFLGVVVIIGIFFRTYHIVERFEFGHDADLYSWIVKDIVINHHFRLIGQLTSAPGIFIGALFYYLLVPFFLLTNMDPIGASILGVIIGIFTILSYYFVLTKLFHKTVGVIGAFLHAILLSTINFDRWIVPTLPTKLWAIWYLYVLILLSKGNFSVLPILAILIGLIWHIHIALAPTLIAVPLALLISRKIPKKKELIIFFVLLFISSLPFLVFETRHNFSQTKSLIKNFTANFGSGGRISEEKEIILGKQMDYGSLNLDPSTKFSLEITPSKPEVDSIIKLKVTTKNPKYSTLYLHLDCGKPQDFQIGSITGEFNWSTSQCTTGSHKLITSARTPFDPLWSTVTNKFMNVLEKQNRNIYDLLFFPFDLPTYLRSLFTLIALLLPVIAYRIKVQSLSQNLIFYSWILGVFLFFTFSSIVVSEYYLASLEVILITSISLIIYRIYQNKKIRKIVILLLALLLIKNLIQFINQENYKKGYLEKKSTIQYIISDAKKNNYPCLSIAYITNVGENVGFRYFMWLYNLHTIKPVAGIPTYNIVLPSELAQDKINQKFGNIGIITPSESIDKNPLEKECQNPNTNLSDPMFGYVE